MEPLINDLEGLAPLLAIATSADFPAIDSLTPFERGWLESQIQEGTRPLLLLAAIRSKWQHSLKPLRELPIRNPDLQWWVSWARSRPAAFGFEYVKS